MHDGKWNVIHHRQRVLLVARDEDDDGMPMARAVLQRLEKAEHIVPGEQSRMHQDRRLIERGKRLLDSRAGLLDEHLKPVPRRPAPTTRICLNHHCPLHAELGRFCPHGVQQEPLERQALEAVTRLELAPRPLQPPRIRSEGKEAPLSYDGRDALLEIGDLLRQLVDCAGPSQKRGDAAGRAGLGAAAD